MPEYLDVVDEGDNVVDRKPRLECLNRGLLHRATIIFVVNSSDEVYLQRRAKDLLFFPRYWSASCGGHVSSGESYL